MLVDSAFNESIKMAHLFRTCHHNCRMIKTAFYEGRCVVMRRYRMRTAVGLSPGRKLDLFPGGAILNETPVLLLEVNPNTESKNDIDSLLF